MSATSEPATTSDVSTTSEASATSEVSAPIVVAGPYYEDLRVGDRFDGAPAMTLTAGHAALHQAIVGDRLRLALDAELCRRVLGPGAPLAHPGLVCDVAIGQSTLATQRVIANLFYRGLVLRRAPRIGDTLRTSTTIVGLRDTSPRPDRPPCGLAALRVRTIDQHGREVLDFVRCAMLPMRDGAARPGNADELGAISATLPTATLEECVAEWDLAAYRAWVGDGAGPACPARYAVAGGDTVSCAPELARLTLNIAAAHHDADAGGGGSRLVYGGHVIGLAFSHLTRALPDLVMVVGWRSCDHVAPVYEGDLLRSSIEIERIDALQRGGALAELRVRTTARRGSPRDQPVLDWRPVAVMV